jgi:hypothetical protein
LNRLPYCQFRFNFRRGGIKEKAPGAEAPDALDVQKNSEDQAE